MAGFKIMLAIMMVVIVVGFFPPMMVGLVEGRDGILGPILWLILFALASAAVGWALPKRNAGA